ncbi:unnamed protein product [Vitrella brassicaformis CCMP3155]|uniref:Uncharacterized protein n=1 Tax=Vitrella brassicaformis (strain CCMP3155) TaxID=1169540 RepID=A0A0G4GSU9_VITBC|nr:unnamed protein product [Vitrella brassicaformis CCMP3155]|eukprot:CEM33773.1 unnamed protein product [Vitrella brassicaformis CCMP3155]
MVRQVMAMSDISSVSLRPSWATLMATAMQVSANQRYDGPQAAAVRQIAEAFLPPSAPSSPPAPPAAEVRCREERRWVCSSLSRSLSRHRVHLYSGDDCRGADHVLVSAARYGDVALFQLVMDRGGRHECELGQMLRAVGGVVEVTLRTLAKEAIHAGSTAIVRHLVLHEGAELPASIITAKFPSAAPTRQETSSLTEAIRLGGDMAVLWPEAVRWDRITSSKQRRQQLRLVYQGYLNQVSVCVERRAKAALTTLSCLYTAAHSHPVLSADAQSAPTLGPLLIQQPPRHLHFPTSTPFGRRIAIALNHAVNSVAMGSTEGSDHQQGAAATWSITHQLSRPLFVIAGVDGRRLSLYDVIEKARRDEAAKHGLTIDERAGSDTAFDWADVGFIEDRRFVSLRLDRAVIAAQPAAGAARPAVMHRRWTAADIVAPPPRSVFGPASPRPLIDPQELLHTKGRAIFRWTGNIHDDKQATAASAGGALAAAHSFSLPHPPAMPSPSVAGHNDQPAVSSAANEASPPSRPHE